MKAIVVVFVYIQIYGVIDFTMFLRQLCSGREYKLCIIMYSIHFGLAPLYIIELVSTVAAHTSCPGLRSADMINYVQPWTRTKFGERAFLYAGPAVWNFLPDDLRRTPTINSLKRKLKTYLFHLCFYLIWFFIFLLRIDICTAPMFLFL